MTYSDCYGEFFGRLDNNGNVIVLHVEDGSQATQLDASVYSMVRFEGQDGTSYWHEGDVSARYDHADGIVLSRRAADYLGIEIES